MSLLHALRNSWFVLCDSLFFFPCCIRNSFFRYFSLLLSLSRPLLVILQSFFFLQFFIFLSLLFSYLVFGVVFFSFFFSCRRNLVFLHLCGDLIQEDCIPLCYLNPVNQLSSSFAPLVLHQDVLIFRVIF